MSIFVIEDLTHAEWCGEFSSFSKAFDELKERAEIPWNSTPNKCPCTNWESCSREYYIVELDNKTKPWKEIERTPVLEISSKGSLWQNG